ncbi:hypothetical protein AMECASPLE_007454 [Ameca splendens]|uniref:Uncharacterized protein n=1 Tax=Ameca splendens TaxID=208324 RepID=A0ABV0XNN1_9TELE
MLKPEIQMANMYVSECDSLRHINSVFIGADANISVSSPIRKMTIMVSCVNPSCFCFLAVVRRHRGDASSGGEMAAHFGVNSLHCMLRGTSLAAVASQSLTLVIQGSCSTSCPSENRILNQTDSGVSLLTIPASSPAALRTPLGRDLTLVHLRVHLSALYTPTKTLQLKDPIKEETSTAPQLTLSACLCHCGQTNPSNRLSTPLNMKILIPCRTSQK